MGISLSDEDLQHIKFLLADEIYQLEKAGASVVVEKRLFRKISLMLEQSRLKPGFGDPDRKPKRVRDPKPIRVVKGLRKTARDTGRFFDVLINGDEKPKKKKGEKKSVRSDDRDGFDFGFY